MSPRNVDRMLMGMALAAAIGSCAWFAWAERGFERSRRLHRDRIRTSPAYGSIGTEEPGISFERWPAPAAQKRGPEWLYDVFTPPTISYDDKARRFAVTSPESTREKAPDGLGLELVAVQRELFGLQLVGFVGTDGHYLGTFENVQTGEVFLAGAGRQVPELAVQIEQFDVEIQPIMMADGTVSRQRRAIAVVRDDRTREVHRLTAGERGYTTQLRAILADAGDPDEVTLTVRQGDEVRSDEESFVVARLQFDPPMAELVPLSAMAQASRRLSLTPPDQPASTTRAPAN